MGQAMPKAVSSVVLKRWAGKGVPFRVGLAEMNGWRPSMEDAHVVVMRDTWGFFGVLDGHGGSQCSAYVATRLTEELETNGKPVDDKAVTTLALKLDAEYLATGQPSGSTGTFVIVTKLESTGGKFNLRVGNIGDSRVLLGKADGTMIEGSGTDGCLTIDHKPDNPDERARIERTGGTVQEVMGVSRVNGDLAVSRAFGDAQYKETGGPAQEDHPVTAAPELFEHTCGASDFLILVCDGISESNFPNAEVVRLAADELKKSAGEVDAEQVRCVADPGAAAAAVCRMALQRGSKDNLSCMIVLLGTGETAGKEKELLPGSIDSLNHGGFRTAYEAMAGHAGMSLAEAAEARYHTIKEEMTQPDASPELTSELTSELAAFGDGPPEDLAAGSEARTQWFAKWVQEQSDAPATGDTDHSNLDQQLMNAMRARGWLDPMANTPLVPPPTVREPVIAAAEGELRQAIQKHFALQWDSRYLGVCGKEGVVIKRDDSDNTSQVRFYSDKAAGPTPMTAWFPNETLQRPRVQVAPLDKLREAIGESQHIDWDEEKHSKAQGEGLVSKIDESMEASLIEFPDIGELWIPTSMVIRE